jgi:16S rRNA (guanine527-N7)-methyltransferase
MAGRSSGGAGDGVSRETVPRPDAAVVAQLVVPGRVALLERYAELLATDGVALGLIGPREVPRLWERHLVNCALLGPLLPDSVSVADLGSGAGLPGLVLAIARPDLRVTLVEPMARRVAFLEEVCAELGLESVAIERTRAEHWKGQATFDAVTARALAPMARLLDWGMPLVGPGGSLLALKGRSAADELSAAEPQLRRWRVSAKVLAMSVPGSEVSTVVRVVRAGGSEIG